MKSSRRHFNASLGGSLSAVAIGISLFAVPAFAQKTDQDRRAALAVGHHGDL